MTVATTKRMRAMLAVKPKTDDAVPLADAVALFKKFPPAKFDQTVEIHMRLGIDPKQADQIIRGSLVLPHGIGKSKRVVVFAKGNLADDAKAAGAEEVGAEELAKSAPDLQVPDLARGLGWVLAFLTPTDLSPTGPAQPLR